MYCLYVTIELQNGTGEYDIFYTFAMGDRLVWETNFWMHMHARTHTHISICILVASENWPVNRFVFAVPTCFEINYFCRPEDVFNMSFMFLNIT
jgi:hypothetical protein